MASFYNQGNQGGNTTSNGFYNGGGYGAQFQQPSQQQQQQQQQYSNHSQFQQQQQQPEQQTNTFQQWMPSSSTQQNQQHQFQQQPQQAQEQPKQTNFWDPSTTMKMAGLAAQAASGGMSVDNVIDMVGAPDWKASSIIPGVDATMLTLRAYFAVDNRYVQRKMRKVLFPFLSKQWRRVMVEGPERVNYAMPNSDENAPDLYLPVMSLITYCLLCALTYGTSGKFNPEVIPDVTTKCFITQVLEVLLIRLGFYMMNAPTPMLDLFCYTGYKYLGLTINMLCGLMLGQLGYGTSGFYVTFVWTASAATYFMLKTMANNIPTETATTGPKREVMVVAFAISQAASMWFVSQTKFL